MPATQLAPNTTSQRLVQQTHSPPPRSADAPPPVRVALLTVSEAAEMLRVSDATIRNWIGAGSVPYIQLPPTGQRKQYRIPLQGLLASLDGNYDLRGALQEQNARMLEANLSED